MKKYKTLTGICLLIATFFVFETVLPPSMEAQEYSDPIFGEHEIQAQGSPRSAFDDQRVLLVGDSQVAGPPGQALGHYLVSEGVTYFARVGRSSWGVQNWWSARQQLDNLIREHRPTLLIFILGGNDWSRVRQAFYPGMVREFWVHVTNSVDRSAPEGSLTSACWIEPPSIIGSHRADRQPLRDEVAQVILNVTGEAQFVKSSDLTDGDFGRTSDGVHFTYRGANLWMQQTMPRLSQCVVRQHPNIREYR